MDGSELGAGASSQPWPALRVADWTATRDTVHMWTQIVGKVRLALAPMVNHWWQTTLYVTPSGLGTSSIPYGRRIFDVEFDFREHRLAIRSSDGGRRSIPLEPKPVSAFYAETMAALDDLGLTVAIRPIPNEVARAIPFPEDDEHASYDPAAVQAFWQQLVAASRVLSRFRSRFIGKVSPVHFWWGSFDLACTRFSGATAPRHRGGVPNCPDWVMAEGYSHELSSCGFWPGGGEEGAFYSYAYPEPDGFADIPVRPAAAGYRKEFGQFLLPYEAVRTATDPEGTLLDFLQTTYAGAADLARWDRPALEAGDARFG